MSEEELIQQHDQMYNRMPDYNIFLTELARRETVRQGERMEAVPRFPRMEVIDA
jgi:hypothetical protein